MQLESINQELSSKDPAFIIQWALDQAKNPVLTTNFGPHEAAILHLAVQIKPDIPVIWIDSGYGTKATYRFADQLIKQLNLNIQVFHPEYSRGFRDAIYGGVPEVDTPEHDEFTRQVKLEPFARAMKTVAPDVWLTAIRKDQTDFRKGLEVVSKTNDGYLRVAPVLNWNELDVEEYLVTQDLPLEEDYYDPTKVYGNRECGLHTTTSK
ncbi:phosphoadenosine phosphosulfate reductase domain-containing protein [Endozoicomonas ascidiicola]|uniref:phosphoadenosine phosphosulfate reductase domain-containing protein n=1 Tax=Endozoicomonas ascidiicola TaxID=1698521 RepID=UPI00082F11BA|nr:phosphoadenosine phosphosulfate reductase family protein [Endozoicomonas ascidiicola]